MKANIPEVPAVRRSRLPKRDALNRLARRLPIPVLLGIGAGLTLAWVSLLCWMAFSALNTMLG